MTRISKHVPLASFIAAILSIAMFFAIMVLQIQVILGKELCLFLFVGLAVVAFVLGIMGFFVGGRNPTSTRYVCLAFGSIYGGLVTSGFALNWILIQRF